MKVLGSPSTETGAIALALALRAKGIILREQFNDLEGSAIPAHREALKVLAPYVEGAGGDLQASLERVVQLGE